MRVHTRGCDVEKLGSYSDKNVLLMDSIYRDIRVKGAAGCKLLGEEHGKYLDCSGSWKQISLSIIQTKTHEWSRIEVLNVKVSNIGKGIAHFFTYNSTNGWMQGLVFFTHSFSRSVTLPKEDWNTY